jgi:serine/threonine-protein kinase
VKLNAGQLIAERYEIDDLIGTGGMSHVYRAHDKKLDRYVTLKVLKEEYLSDENLIERFPKEALAAAAMNHQNIVSIFDHGRDGDVLFIVLEYVDGASLKELITRKAPFDDETNLGVTIQVSEGLSEAHNNNIIHLDVKPQNILITTTSIVKVADFGIARAARNVTLNASSGSMGSVHYFSPEQARGGYIDHKSDIYSLGIVMFEMATGRLPFEGETEVSIALQHINDPLPDISKINPNVSESVIRIIQKATEKSASNRYATIDDMTEDLKRALTDASGAFVVTESNADSPTRTISEENREAVRRQIARQAFLDGTETPEEQNDDDEARVLLLSESKNAYLEDSYVKPPKQRAPRDEKTDRVAIYGGILLGVVLAGIIIAVAWSLYRNHLRSGAGMEEVPAVVGLSREEAETAALRLGLVIREEEFFCGDIYSCDNESCEGECEGMVLFQRIEPGVMRHPDDVLPLVVSLGKGRNMPNLENSTVEDATRILNALNLDLIIETDGHEDGDLPRNMVVSQEPAANEIVRRGDTIILSVSDGPDDSPVSVPRIVGLSEADALELLRELSLQGNATQQSSDGYAAGYIMRQYIIPNEMVSRGTVVNYVVSTGPDSPIPTATPTPTPDPNNPDQPQPTSTPDTNGGTQPTPTPDTNGLTRGTLTVALWAGVPADAEFVDFVVERQIGGGESELTHHRVPVSEFPRNISIEYTDHTVFRIYAVENGVMSAVPFATENRP